VRRGCEYRVIDEDGDEVQCGKPAVAHLSWPGGSTHWYCAPHYDIRVAFVRDCGRVDVLRASGAA
jgi:hypothetical protein